MNRTVSLGDLNFEERDIPPPDSFDAVRVDGYYKEWVLVAVGFFRSVVRYATADEVRQIEEKLK